MVGIWLLLIGAVLLVIYALAWVALVREHGPTDAMRIGLTLWRENVIGFALVALGLAFGCGDVEFDSLTLTGGDASVHNGGAISASTANLTVKNSVITGNAAFHGGGIYFGNYAQHELNIIFTTISLNYATNKFCAIAALAA